MKIKSALFLLLTSGLLLFAFNAEAADLGLYGGGNGRGDAMAEILGQTMDSITVTSPNGAESWTVGSSHNINWTSTGTVGNVNIDYSTNNGSNWTSVAANTANDGTQPWTIPSTPSTTCLVRVQETDGSPSDSSDAVFTILAVSTTSITVTLPNGGENWTAGSMVDIYWTSTGAISNVNIDYSVDGGSNWLPILAGTSNDGHSGDWVLPNITSATCLVRISDAANAAVNDVSDAFFSITIREDDIYEENDTLAAAAEMTPGIHYGLILRDNDYFKVYVEAGKDLVVRTMGAAISAAEVSDIDIELYNASGDLLVSSAGDSTMETLCLSNLAAGWYYIRGYWLGTAHYYALGIESGDLPLGEVRGRVTDIHGSGIANVWVTFYEPSGSWSLVRGFVLTDGNGDYRFAYSAGDHKVLFDACYHTNQVVGSYVNEWYNDAATIDTAQTLTTAAGSSLTGIDAVLGDAGMITGVVTGPEGEPLLLARVQAYDASGTRKASTYTLADGTYRLRGIAAAGNYIVRFLPRNWTTAFAVEWYNNKSSSGAADAVAVVLASETPNINAQLGYGGSIGGTVTDAASGLPIANVIVYAVDPDNYIVISSALTNASGQYTVFWIPAGNVKLYFNAGTTGYGSEWYSDKASFATADLVPVAAAQNVTGINAQLATASPTITVTSPNGGESWSVGSSHNITWTTTGTIADVKIEYSTDSGTSYTTVIASTANTGSYAWTVPGTLSTTCLVRVSDAADGDPLDASDAVFTIVSPITDSITVTAPNGGESWTVGSSHDITWSSTGTIANVRIEYSTNNGSDWSDVIASTANTGTYAWTIPNAPSTTCSVRVSDAANAAVNDASDAVFTIVLSDDDIYEDNDTLAAAATLTPGVYEGLVLRDEDYFKVYVEEGKDLQVSISGAALPPASVGDMDIELYDASGNLLVAAASDSTSEMLYLSNMAAGWYYIRNAWVGTAHNYTLGIFSGDLPLGEISGRVTDIRGSGIANVLVMFYEPSGSWSLLRGYALTDSNGDYRFAYTAGDHKVQFSTTRPECTVIGSYVDEWYDDVATLGEAQTLSTAAGSSLTGIDAVLGDAGMITGVVTGPEGQPLNYAQVRAYDESGIARVGTRTLPDGTYQLRGIPTSGNYRVRFIAYYWGYAVEWYNNKSSSGAADAVAVVLGSVTPNVNAQLGYGGSIGGTVTDAVSGLPIANVTVSARDEANIAFSSSVTDASGQYTINQVPACNVKLYFNAGTTGYASEWYNDKADFAMADLVPVAAGQNVTGINAQLATASPTITVTSPNGGENWTSGTSHNITWTSTGTVGNVNIDYSTNSGGDWTSVAANTANDGTQPWTIPSTPSTTCLVRVQETDGSPSDSSDAVFTILAVSTTSITVTLPNGGENWTAGSMVDVDWTSTGAISNVNIDYSIDGGSNWLPILAGTSNDGHAGDWVLPNITSATCLVRVSDAANAAVNDVSDAFFSITIREDDIYEENDTLAAAAEMTPGTYYGLILRDDDYFKVYVEAGKDLVVRTMGAAISAADGSDIDIELYSASGDLLVASAGDSTMETLCLSNLAAGWYYIRGYWLGTAHYYALGIESGDLPLGEVRGRVTDIRGSGIANVWVTFYEPSGSWSLVRGFVLTDGNGDYRFAYSAGDHKVLFDACYPTNQVAGSYVNEWYNDAATIDTAQTQTTAAGSSLTGIDAVLGDAGMITGVVTGPEGQPLQYAYAQAYDASGTVKASTYTLADGTYRLRGFAAAGNYIVRFRPPSWISSYAVEWYNNKSSSGAADAVAVVLGSVTPNVNAQLGYGGSIGGTVTDAASGLPIANVRVYAVDPDNYIAFSSALTNASGNYSVSWIPAGNVKLYFNAGTTGYGSEWYNDKASFATADLVPVAAAQNVTGINAQLATASPTLTVTSPNGAESWTVGSSHNITWSSTGTVGNVNIDYSTNNGSSWTSVAANTANDGTQPWTIPSTPSTTCLVRVRDAVDSDPSDTSNAVFTIAASSTETVSTPTTPTGPSAGLITTSYDFSTGGSTSSLGHSVQYKFDWDDGSDSGWLAEGTTTASHIWAAAGTYDVRAMARCSTHTTIESLWSDTYAVTITDGGSTVYPNSPANRLILPEVNWAEASGGGDWVSEVQLTDVTGGSVVQVYYNSDTNRRGPFTLWNNGGGAAGSSASWGNVLQTIDALDAGAFTYYGTGGSLEMVTQDGSHAIQAAIRSYNGNFSRTFPALVDVDTNTAALGRTMMVPNMSMDTAFRPSLVLFNPSSDSVTAEVQIVGSNGGQVGPTINRTVAPYEMAGVAGLRDYTYSNADFWVTVTGGSGRLIVSGQSANNVSNDPAAHVAVQTGPGYVNSPADRLIFPEVNWASASGGGDWVAELHITDLSGGAVVQVYYNSGINRRGPFTLWTNSGGANRSMTFSNVLQTIDALDSGAFAYYGTGGALELITQDGSHVIQAALKGYNGNVTRTFPAFRDVEANTAALGRELLIPNLSMNTAYRPSVAVFNPSADGVTMEVRIIGSNGSQIGSTISLTLAGYEMAGVAGLRDYTYSNACVKITVTGGSGRVLASGQSANNVTNDPAAHIAVQAE